jgi:two-component system chemotaxis response regulator CheY
MSTSTLGPDNKMKPGGASAKAPLTGADKRRRRRVKISAQVHVKTKDCGLPFEEVCKSVDVSRDGVLFTSARAGYWKGQILDVTFPYSSATDTWNQAQSAEVVRVDERPDKTFSVAVHFHKAKEAARTTTKRATSDPYIGGLGEHAATSARQSKPQSVVLAIEPDLMTADMMRDVLKPDGYTILVVRSAEAALDVLRTTVPAVFIAEAEGEGMSGLDLCVIIKGNERLKGVPVILLTRTGNPADYSASEDLGAVMCIARPFQPEKLLQVVRLVAPPPLNKSTYGASIYAGAIERVL